jgi:hypothetical protein
MAETKRLLMMAEDQLTQYSTDALKIQKLRQKISLLSVTTAEQRRVKEELIAEMPTDGFSKIILEQRQTAALPFWGIAGLGLLLGISTMQPLDLLATLGGGAAAIAIQRWGWKLQARQLLIQTLEEIEERMKQPNA